MTQIINGATRKDEMLDLIFTNNSELIHDIDSKPRPNISDHNLVTAVTGYFYKQTCNFRETSESEELTVSERFQALNFHEADWNGIQLEIQERLRLNNDWMVLSEMEPDEGFLWFYSQLIDICELYVPKKRK